MEKYFFVVIIIFKSTIGSVFQILLFKLPVGSRIFTTSITITCYFCLLLRDAILKATEVFDSQVLLFPLMNFHTFSLMEILPATTAYDQGGTENPVGVFYG